MNAALAAGLMRASSELRQGWQDKPASVGHWTDGRVAPAASPRGLDEASIALLLAKLEDDRGDLPAPVAGRTEARDAGDGPSADIEEMRHRNSTYDARLCASDRWLQRLEVVPDGVKAQDGVTPTLEQILGRQASGMTAPETDVIELNRGGEPTAGAVEIADVKRGEQTALGGHDPRFLNRSHVASLRRAGPPKMAGVASLRLTAP